MKYPEKRKFSLSEMSAKMKKKRMRGLSEDKMKKKMHSPLESEVKRGK